MSFLKNVIKPVIPSKFWNNLRKKQILSKHKKVADLWNPIINDYLSGKLEKYPLRAKRTFPTSKIIWQYWGQGLDANNMPEIVHICFDSVDRYKGEYKVIRLDDAMISEYIDLPDFVWERRKNQQFTRTFFSDLLRVALLSTYGGVWLDATILLTGKLPKEYEDLDFFMYQRSEAQPNKTYWENTYAYYFGWDIDYKVRVLSSVIFARRNNEIISSLKDLLLHFWKTQEYIPDYFCFQILFNELIVEKCPERNCPIVSDCIPHLFQTKINNGNYGHMSYEQIIALTPIHKMSYYDAKALSRLKGILKHYETCLPNHCPS